MTRLGDKRIKLLEKHSVGIIIERTLEYDMFYRDYIKLKEDCINNNIYVNEKIIMQNNKTPKKENDILVLKLSYLKTRRRKNK